MYVYVYVYVPAEPAGGKAEDGTMQPRYVF